jgi:hypothetical protein
LISGFLVLIAVVITAKGFSIPTTRVNLGIAGLVSGIMGTLAAIGGPPIALVYQNESGARIRTSLSGFFIAGGVISIVTLSLAGRFGIHEVMLGLTLLPGTLIGFLGSSRVLPWLDGKYTKKAVLLVATVSASVVIVDQLL